MIIQKDKVSSFSAALTYLLDAKGYGARARLARKVEVSGGYISDLASGKRRGDEDLREKISQYFEKTYDQMLEIGNLLLEGKDPEKFKKASADKGETITDDFYMIPLYKARLSGGAGSFPEEGKVADFAFRKRFIRRKGSPGNMALFIVTGDSMEPFICEKDIVLVDMSLNDPKEIVDGKTYAFREDCTIKVKKLSWQGDNLLVTSENSPLYPPYSAEIESFHLLGKVIWVGHEMD